MNEGFEFARRDTQISQKQVILAHRMANSLVVPSSQGINPTASNRPDGLDFHHAMWIGSQGFGHHRHLAGCRSVTPCSPRTRYTSSLGTDKL